MDNNEIKAIFDDIGIVGENFDLKSYAVTIPLVNINGIDYIIFEIRSKNLSQPGEISLPGGKIEKGESRKDAAIRETCEELLMDKSDMEVIGQADILVTQYGKIIYPFIIRIKNANKINFSHHEVEKLIYVPIEFFKTSQPKTMKVKVVTEPLEEFPYDIGLAAKDYYWQSGLLNVYFYKYEEHVIWGLTAKIIHGFINKITNDRTEWEYDIN